MEKVISAREHWFLNRVGHRVFRNNCGLNSKLDLATYEHGLHIHDALQAKYLFGCESDFAAEGEPLRYFDTKEEVAEYESSLKSKTQE